MRKGYISVEASIFIGIIFLLFGMSYLVYITKSSDVHQARKELLEKADCLRIANAIDALHVLGKGSQVTMDITHHAVLSHQRIETNNTFCTFSSRANLSRTIAPGNVTIMMKESVEI